MESVEIDAVTNEQEEAEEENGQGLERLQASVNLVLTSCLDPRPHLLGTLCVGNLDSFSSRGAGVPDGRNCRSRLQHTLVSALPPAPIVKRGSSCRVCVVLVRLVPSIEIYRHLACSRSVCFSAQCRALRLCSPPGDRWKHLGSTDYTFCSSWGPLLSSTPWWASPAQGEDAWVNAAALEQREAQMPLNCLQEVERRVRAMWFAGWQLLCLEFSASQVTGLVVCRSNSLAAQRPEEGSPSCQADGPWRS
ncbi:uncharacterized protein LOC114706738 [Peromyscus leucopus]|uniref:uncharacterized protein LOC114706738 n=1 Tax=Peromyscus leucopus TaxID=10041 RepID=UPI001884FF7A|nr:uncharacterized protein LOC114706738 [Peromyscus leucopus]